MMKKDPWSTPYGPPSPTATASAIRKVATPSVSVPRPVAAPAVPSAPAAAPAAPSPVQLNAGQMSTQAQLQDRAGLVGSPVDPNISQDAFAGNVAMALRNAGGSPTAGGAPSPSYVPYTPPGASVPPGASAVTSPSDYAKSVATALSSYKPEAVDYTNPVFNGRGIEVTSSNIPVPERSSFASDADFQQAMDTYNYAKLQEESKIANSSAFQYANSQNAQAQEQQLLKMAEQAKASAIEETDRKLRIQRQSLIDAMAARGVTPTTDSQAMAELQRFDQQAQSMRDAAALEASAAFSNKAASVRAQMQADAQARVKNIADAIRQVIDSKAKQTTADAAYLKSQAASDKNDIDKAYKEGKISLEERDMLLKEAESPANIALKEAQAGKASAEADYTAGAKTANAEANTGYMAARTKEILDLLPYKIDDIKSEIAKRARAGTGGGGVANDGQIAEAYQSFLQQGIEPSKAELANRASVMASTGMSATDVSSLGLEGAGALASAKGSASSGGFRF
ncbi:MAG TPA: hypothetical protein PLS35_02430 [Nitrospira sp.]|nr:hypothetical protein [Nitrospira sp.]